MELDQRFEQLNKDVKSDGGMVGLTENEDKLRRWTICSPEISRAVVQFEKGIVLEPKDHTIFHHHEDSDSFKARFSKHVSDLTTEFKQLGNPFLPDEAAELIQLGARDVMGPEFINTVRAIEDLGISQHKEFRENRIIKKTKWLHDAITKSKLPLFKSINTRGKSSSRAESKELKLHVRLFSQMYIASQIRGGDMDRFFSYKTLKYPPALTKCGEMRSGEKSDLLKCLQSTPPPSHLPSVSAEHLKGLC